MVLSSTFQNKKYHRLFGCIMNPSESAPSSNMQNMHTHTQKLATNLFYYSSNLDSSWKILAPKSNPAANEAPQMWWCLEYSCSLSKDLSTEKTVIRVTHLFIMVRQDEVSSKHSLLKMVKQRTHRRHWSMAILKSSGAYIDTSLIRGQVLGIILHNTCFAL